MGGLVVEPIIDHDEQSPVSWLLVLTKYEEVASNVGNGITPSPVPSH
jgi:hypothetical protein